MKLELKHLSPYLPYGLKVIPNEFLKHQTCVLGIQLDPLNIEIVRYGEIRESKVALKNIKPVLKPLSDLYNTDGFSLSKMISHGYHNSFWSKEKFSVKHVYYHDLLILLEHHFDVFGLIDSGLAIDVNTEL
ncbi:hypothetical protein A0256_23255 [Mucilaginibacter sp. PAMC 26640]|nr:hypothetical protein A0256_23255 [Mucilaginibacter sp. PAMC 26640]